ncbi:pyruvate kinase-like protein [Halenospora varia]|nr:pyruvate kinase-like protein [Halenospora varia]
MAIKNAVPSDRTALPRHIDTLLQIRTGMVQIAAIKNLEDSGIYKTPKSTPVKVGLLGCEGDERQYPPHQSSDNALLQYDSRHYLKWKSELPAKSHFFVPGAFGENLVTEKMSEEDVCIGDVMKIGKDLVVQVTKPRAPCYKLDMKFETKDISARCRELYRTGWLYRMLTPGSLMAGDEITLIERMNPEWTVRRVQDIMWKDLKNENAMKELVAVPELGVEIKEIISKRLAKFERMRSSKQADASKWKYYRLSKRKQETPRIAKFVFEADTPDENPIPAPSGSHIRLKIGNDGRLTRAYSIVSGDSNCFTLGIALDEASRGGSKFLHHEAIPGYTSLPFNKIKSDFPIIKDAKKHILIAGGIGITAFILMADELLAQGADFHLHYAIRSSEDIAFRKLLAKIPKQHITFADASQSKRLDIPNILKSAKEDKDTHLYICGPNRLLSAVTSTAQALSIPSSQIHYEAFTASTTGDPFTVELSESKKKVEVKEEQTLLDVLREVGLDVPSSCEVGNCGSCKVSYSAGRVEHRGTGLLEGEKGGMMLSCVSRGVGGITVDL